MKQTNMNEILKNRNLPNPKSLIFTLHKHKSTNIKRTNKNKHE